MENGKVCLVGAGPGDLGLMTLKGMQAVQHADVIVYDSLVGEAILAILPERAKKIDVGKRASRHTMPQEEINALLLEEAQAGKFVVRLKGGDPFLFGRGGEELELLSKHHIPFEIIPGIPSAISVPAYNGIPVTHRDYTSSLHIITGHKRAGETYDIDFRALVRTKGTLVFLMGIAALPDICRGLLEAGIDPELPAAVLQKGTTAGQKKIIATVSTLPDEVKKQGVFTPAIIVVGQVCSLSEDFAWFEKQPLFGHKILLTRPKELVSSMAARLRQLGAEVLELPAIETAAIPGNTSLQAAFSRLSSYQWIAFTSPTGVRIFFEELAAAKTDLRALGHLKFAVLGEGTARALRERGFFADLMPEVYDGASLGAALAQVCDPEAHILLPRAAKGNPEILEQLRNFHVDDIPTYETTYRRQEILDEKKLFGEGGIDCAVFTSSSSVRGFLRATEGMDYSQVRAACIGRQTRETAERAGMQTCMAEKATMDSLAELVIFLCRNSDRKEA